MARAKRRPVELSPAEEIIAFIERYLVVPDGEHVGKPIVLRPWQREIIAGIYDGLTRRAIVSFARKNGKSALIAMLVLAHVIGPQARRNTHIYSAAQSRDQASIVFGLAAKMVRMSAVLNDLVDVKDSAKELFCPKTGVRYKALSADATTAYGLSPVLAIHDELGQVRGPRQELYEALESAMGAHERPLSITISTQAPNDADLLSTLIDDARKSNDPRMKLFLYAADPADDPWSRETWARANPALADFRSLRDMQELSDIAQRLPAHEAAFRNLNLNQRIAAEEHFLSADVWQSNSGDVDLTLFDNEPVYVGVDLSSTSDLTAIVAVAADVDGRWHIRAWFFIPGEGLAERARHDRVPYNLWADQDLIIPTPGKSVDYDWVAGVIVPILQRMDVRSIAYDRYQFEHLKQAFARREYEPEFLSEAGQGYKTMTPALRTLETMALDAKLRHGGHPILTWNASNARAQPGPAGERKLTKAKSTGRIDGIVALTMALYAATATSESSDFDLRNIRLI